MILKMIFTKGFIIWILGFACPAAMAQAVTEVRRYLIEDSIHLQGVAVDKSHFYVMSNTCIYKYSKADGRLVSYFNGNSILKHLNSGIVVDGKLYCAHSNFPESPMASSIEVFDTQTMEHIGNHSFGLYGGSATWVDKKDGYWWVAFANYDGTHSSEGRDNRWTQLVKFSANWQRLSSWIYPQNVLSEFSPYSNSGGNWSKDGFLFVTGHDKKEVYILQLPSSGFTLQFIKAIPSVNGGQGIAIDRSVKSKELLYAVSREGNAIIVQELLFN